MVYLRQTNLIKCAIYSFIISSSFSLAEAARKGTPGSPTRNEWCSSKMDSCVEDANNDCEDTHGWGSSTDLALCKSSEVNVCKNTYGSTSDCETRDRVDGDSLKDKKIGNKENVILPPSKRTRSSKDKLKPKKVQSRTELRTLE